MWSRLSYGFPCVFAAITLLFPVANASASPRPHVVFVLIDALRARNLGCYGYALPTSPSIDRLAQDGVLFEQAISVGGNTTTVMPAVFTGHYPFFEYGDPWTEAPFGMERFRRTPGLGLPEAMTTLAEHLSSAGYRTAGFIANPYLKSTFSMHQGFEHYEEILNETGVPFGQAEQVLDRALRYLGSQDWSRPSFLYLHFMDTHGPYREPEAQFLGGDPPRPRGRHYESWESWEKNSKGGDESERRYWMASYDSSVRYVDEAVGRILQFYRDRDLLGKTLFVVTADHGDEFLEHGGTTHKGTLFEELIHVPLVVRAPKGLRQVRLPQMVRSFDVMPTILDYAGIPRQGAGMDAVSFRPLLEGRPFAGPTTVYAGFPWIRMMRTDRYKLLRNKDGSESFYDLATDPHERVNLVPSKDARAERVRAVLAQLMDQTAQRLRQEGGAKGGFPAVTIDEDTRAKLKALGYLQ